VKYWWLRFINGRKLHEDCPASVNMLVRSRWRGDVESDDSVSRCLSTEQLRAVLIGLLQATRTFEYKRTSLAERRRLLHCVHRVRALRFFFQVSEPDLTHRTQTTVITRNIAWFRGLNGNIYVNASLLITAEQKTFKSSLAVLQSCCFNGRKYWLWKSCFRNPPSTSQSRCSFVRSFRLRDLV